jgi:hypothetical protein
VEAVGVAAVVVLTVLRVPAAVGVFGAPPGPAARHRPAALRPVYVGYRPIYKPTGTLTPISTATNKAEKPIRVRCSCNFVITPDGKTPLRHCPGQGRPDQHRDHHARQADPVRYGIPEGIAITPQVAAARPRPASE